MFRRIFFFVFCLLILLHCQADASFIRESSSDLFFLKGDIFLRSKDFGENWKKISSPLSQETEYEIKRGDNNKLLVFYKEGNSLFLKEAKDDNALFGKKKEVKANIKEKHAIISSGGKMNLFFLNGNSLYYSFSTDGGKTFSPEIAISENAEAKDFTVQQVDGSRIDVFFAGEYQIHHTKFDLEKMQFSQPEPIYKTADVINKIIGNTEGEGVFWVEETALNSENIFFYKNGIHKKVYESKKELSKFVLKHRNMSTILMFFDGDDQFLMRIDDFGQTYAPPKIINMDGNFDTFIFEKDKLFLFREDLKKIGQKNEAPLVEIKNPPNSFNSSTEAFNFKISSQDYDFDKMSLGITLSPYPSFEAGDLVEFINISAESFISVPFPEGPFYVRAFATDGISTSYSSTIECFIDKTPPLISIIKPEIKTITGTVTIDVEGIISKKAQISLNGKIITGESFLTFETSYKGQSGENILHFIATDEAGNTTQESISLFFNLNAPRIEASSPKENSILKSDATIVVNAFVEDEEKDLSEDSEVLVFIGEEEPDSTLFFDYEDMTIKGLVKIPEGIKEGKELLTLKIKDLHGNMGEKSIPIIIDNTPPKLVKSSISSSQKEISFFAKEDGSGLDLAGSFALVKGGSIEILGELKSASGKVFFVPKTLIPLGNYSFELTLRDLAGNISSLEVEDLVISNSIKISSDLSSSSIKILAMAAGPNPFSPRKGDLISFKYSLSSPSSMDFYLFSMSGETIFKKTIDGALQDGIFTWDGKNCFGQIASPGVYIYVLSARDLSGNRDSYRGKLIVI